MHKFGSSTNNNKAVRDRVRTPWKVKRLTFCSRNSLRTEERDQRGITFSFSPSWHFLSRARSLALSRRAEEEEKIFICNMLRGGIAQSEFEFFRNGTERHTHGARKKRESRVCEMLCAKSTARKSVQFNIYRETIKRIVPTRYAKIKVKIY
jgi:hypothetical protein